MKRILISALIILGCIAEPATTQDVAIVHFEWHKTHSSRVLLKLAVVDGHTYIVASKAVRDSGVAILHAESCYCKAKP